mmetsp:Transcript_51765/g.145874  ORF Transcript_51765/g.145874 Transcript_51765/m.145874 type:complete len:214 (-) Transcript_51765:7-648(-)
MPRCRCGLTVHVYMSVWARQKSWWLACPCLSFSAAICARSAWFGMSSWLAIISPVFGDVGGPSSNHRIISARSYVCPSSATTGSVMGRRVMGHRSAGGRDAVSKPGESRAAGGSGQGAPAASAAPARCPGGKRQYSGSAFALPTQGSRVRRHASQRRGAGRAAKRAPGPPGLEDELPANEAYDVVRELDTSARGSIAPRAAGPASAARGGRCD